MVLFIYLVLRPSRSLGIQYIDRHALLLCSGYIFESM